MPNEVTDRRRSRAPESPAADTRGSIHWHSFTPRICGSQRLTDTVLSSLVSEKLVASQDIMRNLDDDYFYMVGQDIFLKKRSGITVEERAALVQFRIRRPWK